MTITVDPDDLTLATDFSNTTGDVWFNTTTLRIGIDPTYASSMMDADGLTMQCLYSFAKETWQANQAYAAFEFPFTPITDESFELVELGGDVGQRGLDARQGHLAGILISRSDG